MDVRAWRDHKRWLHWLAAHDALELGWQELAELRAAHGDEPCDRCPVYERGFHGEELAPDVIVV